MKKSIFLVIVFLLSCAGFTQAQRESRNVDNFNKVSLGVAADLYLTQGNTTSLSIEGDEDDLEEIITEVRNHTLVIRRKSNFHWFSWNDKVKIYLTVPEINAISLGGSGKILGTNQIHSDDLDISVSGSGHVDMEVNAERLSQNVSGSGSIELSGKSNEVELRISGSGNVDAEDLQADNYDVRISGSGRCRIYVMKSIMANISGSGHVYYRGNPDKVISNVSGSGKVRTL